MLGLIWMTMQARTKKAPISALSKFLLNTDSNGFPYWETLETIKPLRNLSALYTVTM